MHYYRCFSGRYSNLVFILIVAVIAAFVFGMSGNIAKTKVVALTTSSKEIPSLSPIRVDKMQVNYLA